MRGTIAISTSRRTWPRYDPPLQRDLWREPFDMPVTPATNAEAQTGGRESANTRHSSGLEPFPAGLQLGAIRNRGAAGFMAKGSGDL